MLTILNDFHNTTAQVRPGLDGILSASQVLRVRRKLCGVSECRCGGTLGERGPRAVEIEPLGDGRVRLTPLPDYD